MISSKKNEWMMEFLFCICIKNILNLFICLFRSICIYYSNSIHDSMDMSIYSYIRSIIENSKDYFRCLDTNTWKSLHEQKIIRNNTIILICDYCQALLFSYTCFQTQLCYNIDYNSYVCSVFFVRRMRTFSSCFSRNHRGVSRIVVWSLRPL